MNFSDATFPKPSRPSLMSVQRESRFLHTAICSPPYRTLTYAVPAHLTGLPWPKGLRVLVPMGKSLRVAVVLGSPEHAPEGIECKELLWPLEHAPATGEVLVALAEDLSIRQMEPVGRILSHMLPSKLRTLPKAFRVNDETKPRSIPLGDFRDFSATQQRELVPVWIRNAMHPTSGPGKLRTMVRLAVDPPWQLRPNAKREIAVMEHLFNRGVCSRPNIIAALGQGAGPALNSLARKEMIIMQEERETLDCSASSENVPCSPTSFSSLLQPSEEQAAALEVLQADLDAGTPATHLLHGITGSGKTLVYHHLAARCLSRGRSVILLAPEVALASTLYTSTRKALPEANVLLYHGYLPTAARDAAFSKVANGEPTIIVGTRSALFLPVPSPGLFVLDEEHDESFKQEERLNYQAKEVAFFLARAHNALLVLGSATPDLKTFHATCAGAIRRLSMSNRVGGGSLPQIRIVDTAGLKADEPLAEQSVNQLHSVIESGGQAIIMLNRRGYSPLMYCLHCEQAVACPHCRVGLTYHKARERLVCHYCGYTLPFPTFCPDCGQNTFLPMGGGTEQLEEKIPSLLPPNTAVLRLDRDTTRRQERMDAILDDFAHQKAQVLIGTQMLSKGHHFPEVRLVIAAEADLGLNLPDYRAAERTFQLMLQVAGRAGRGAHPGEVFIQTRSPAHPFWQFVLESDYKGFYEREIALRERFGYPPFIKLGLIRLSYPLNWPQGSDIMASIASALRKKAASSGIRLLGPAPAPLSQIRGRKRFQCLVKAKDWQSIRALYAQALHLRPGNGKLRLQLDLDPVNML